MRLAGILLAAVAFMMPAVADAASPTGRFVVVAAHRNPSVTNPQAEYRLDDPQLVDRIVTLTANGAAFDGASIACSRVETHTAPQATQALFRQMFSEPRRPGGQRFARAADFGLVLPATVQVTRFHCANAERHGAEWNGAALFPIGRGAMGLRLVDDFLLILRPAPDPFAPSFDCGRAGLSPAEHTICSDAILAGWDRSVAKAYRSSGSGVAEQRAWLAERDKCGTDAECLHEALALRTTNLLAE